jgi:hypothetical protein
VGRPLWREDGSVFCICFWVFPMQSFSGPSPLVLATIFYCLRFETSHFVSSYDSQGHSGGIRPRLHTGWSYLTLINCPAYNILAQTSQKTPFLCCSLQLLPCKHACLRSCYSVMAVVYLLILRSHVGVTIEWGMDWWMNLLTTHIHNLELQALTPLSLISTPYKSLHTKSSPPCSVFTSRCLVTALNNGDSSASVLMSSLSIEYPTAEVSTEL